ncbi:MAG: TIGR01777 family oxidoreductase [Sedimentisphaerales bacterium]|nr:TIGR01777 family oxidoreductase [Sedimentisphaerales bacterium]
MKVLIAGASGFIGKALCRELCRDYEVIALSRDVRRAAAIIGEYAKIIEWDGRTTGTWVKYADGAYAIINLAGESIASGKWIHSKKAAILHSRLDSTRAIASGIKQLINKPSVVIQASAIGYYGNCGEEELTEKSPSGKGFLSEVCQGVELCTEPLPGLGVRLVVIRSGVVLDKDGGALPRLAKPFKYFLGGYPGSGKQWFSWITLEDEIAAIKFLMENEKQQGVFNLSSSEPVMMKLFCRKLGSALKSPSWTFVPGFVLRMFLGEMADEMILSGQKVIPEKLLAAGFKFKYPKVSDALKTIFS